MSSESNVDALSNLFINMSPGGAGCLGIAEIEDFCRDASYIYTTLCADICDLLSACDDDSPPTSADCPDGQLSGEELQLDGIPTDVLLLWTSADSDANGCLAGEDFEDWCREDTSSDRQDTCCNVCNLLDCAP